MSFSGRIVALTILSKNKDIVIQKSAYGNFLLLLTRTATLNEWKIC